MAPKTKTASKPHSKMAASVSRAQAEMFDSDSDNEKQLSRTEPHFESFDQQQDESDDDDDESVDIVVDREMKDESEEELEHLVFGDSTGFRDALSKFDLEPTGAGFESDSEAEEDADLNEVPDDNLFFFDSGPAAGVSGALVQAKTDDESEEDDDKPAWEDSDDERVAVSLATISRLRKLRETEEDDVVSGKEYVRRLRKQYTRLYPTPDWALQATGKSKRKRTYAVEDGESGDESVSEMDEDEDDLSTQPLARLLKDADILARTSRGPVKRRKLQAGTIDIQRLNDVCKIGPSAVTSLSFHPTYPLLLSSGPSSRLNLYHVNSSERTPHPLLTSLHMQRTPLTTTAFHPSPSDSRIFLSARRRYFHVWNLTSGSVEKVSRVYGQQHEQRSMEHFSLSPNGKYMGLRGSSKKGGGVVNILDAYTLQWITQARIESRGGIADFVWWGDGNGMSIVGKNGEVTEYSMKDGVIARWTDEGAVGTTVIAVGGKSGRDSWLGGDRWVAVGSSSGVVNIYDRRAWISGESEATEEDAGDIAANRNENLGIPKNPKPTRSLGHLTMPISHLAFTQDGQILAMASKWKRNALKLVHLPSGTVFKNFPTPKTQLDRISSLAWGRPSEEDEKEGSLALLAVGTEMGRIRLWEVRV